MNETCSCKHEIHLGLKKFDRVAVNSRTFAPLYRCRECGRLYALPGANPYLREVSPAEAERQFGVRLGT